MSIRLTPLPDIRPFYADYLKDYNSPATRKRLMTREIKNHAKFIGEIEAALARTGSSKGWYLGDKYYQHHLNHYKRELAIMESIRDDINKP